MTITEIENSKNSTQTLKYKRAYLMSHIINYYKDVKSAYEMIRVSLVVACPTVFILLCDLSQHGEVFKLMKVGQF